MALPAALAKADLHGQARVEFGTEKPHYPALTRSINGYYTDMLLPLGVLRLRVFGALTAIPDAKAGDDEPFTTDFQQLQIIDGAIDTYLRELAGPDRSPTGFVAPTGDGIIQQRNLFAYAVGIGRAGDQTGKDTTLTADRNSPATMRMLTDAFQRLSENGRLRLEGIRDDVHEVLANGIQAGLSPVEVGRQLGQLFSGVGDYDFQRLARTETAFAAEAGSRDQYRALGVQQVEILVSADACPICQGYADQVVEIDNTEDQPPYHPNCLCSTAPVAPAEDQQ